MDNRVFHVLGGMLLLSTQGGMGIPNCNITNPTEHQQGPCCLQECDHTSEETICEYECPKDMFLSQNMLWDKIGGSLCRHGCRQTCPDNYDGIRINDMCVECFILCRLEIFHTSCKCQNEKIKNEENSLQTKDYIIMALAITSFLLLVGLVMVCCYWKRKRNKDNTKTTENIEMRLQGKDIRIKDNGNIQETKIEIELVDDKPKTIAEEAQRKQEEKTRYTKDPTEPVVNTVKKRQSTKRIESAVYDNAEAIGLNRKLHDRVPDLFEKTGRRFGSTHDPSGGKGENMDELGKSIEVDATEKNAFTQEQPYENTHITNKDNRENQTCEHDDLYQNVTNISGGKSCRSSAIQSDNGENDKQVGTDSATVIKSYETVRESNATNSVGETSVNLNTCSANDERQASSCVMNIANVKKVTLNFVNQKK